MTDILSFTYTVRYRKGSENCIADFLSRASIPGDTEFHDLSTENQEKLAVNSIFTRLQAKLLRMPLIQTPKQTVAKWFCSESLSLTEEAVIPFQAIKNVKSVTI